MPCTELIIRQILQKFLQDVIGRIAAMIMVMLIDQLLDPWLLLYSFLWILSIELRKCLRIVTFSLWRLNQGQEWQVEFRCLKDAKKGKGVEE